MRRSTAVLFAAALLAACDVEPVVPDPAVAKPQMAAVAQQRYITISGPNPCDPAIFMTLSGYVHQDFETSFDNAGGVHTRVHINPVDVSGTGTDGVTYAAHGATNQTINSKAGAAETFTFVNTFNVRGGKGGTDFVVHETIHMTVNANGESTATVVNQSTQCN